MFSDQDIMAATVIERHEKGMVMSFKLPSGHVVKSAPIKEAPRGEALITWCSAVRNRHKGEQERAAAEAEAMKARRKSAENITPAMPAQEQEDFVSPTELDALTFAREQYDKHCVQCDLMELRLKELSAQYKKDKADRLRWQKIFSMLNEEDKGESDELSSESTEDDS